MNSEGGGSKNKMNSPQKGKNTLYQHFKRRRVRRQRTMESPSSNKNERNDSSRFANRRTSKRLALDKNSYLESSSVSPGRKNIDRSTSRSSSISKSKFKKRISQKLPPGRKSIARLSLWEMEVGELPEDHV